MHRGTNTESSELYYDVKSSATTYAHFQLSEEDVITKAEVKLSSAIIAEQRAHQEFEDEGVINLDEFDEKEERNLGFEIDGLKDEETNTIKKIAKLDFELQQLQNEETKINKKFESSSIKDNQILKIDKEIKFLEIIEKIIEKNIKFSEELARSSIEASVRECLKNHFIGKIKFDLTPDYQLKVTKPKKDSKNIARNNKDTSGGEPLLIGQAYVASLLKYCIGRKNLKFDLENDQDLWVLKGTQLPFVIDSPFGGQGKKYRRGSCNIVTESAQVIYLLSETQADTTVYNALKDKVGKVYAMIGYRSGNDELLEEISEKDTENLDDYLSWGKSKKIFGVEYDKGGNDRTVFKTLKKDSWVKL